MVSVNCSNEDLDEAPSFVPSLPESEGLLLDLRGNRLTSLGDADSIDNFAEVTRLVASDNLITSVRTSELPPKLRELQLDGNRLRSLSSSVIARLKSLELEAIYLGHNRFECSCKSKELFEFVKQNIHLFKDLKNITLGCKGNEDKPLYTYTLSEFCSSAAGRKGNH